MLEAPLRRKIVKYLEGRGAYVYHPHGAGSAASGTPDLLCCYRGRFLGLEVKRPGKDATELQAHTLGKIKRAGGVSRVIYSVEDAQRVLDRVDARLAVGKSTTGHPNRRQTSRSGQ